MLNDSLHIQLLQLVDLKQILHPLHAFHTLQQLEIARTVFADLVPAMFTRSPSDNAQLKSTKGDVVVRRGDISQRVVPFTLVKLFQIWQGALDEANALDTAAREWRQVGEEGDDGLDMGVEVESVAPVQQVGSLVVYLPVTSQYCEIVFNSWIIDAMVCCLHASCSEAVCSHAVGRAGMALWIASFVSARIDGA